MIRFITGLALRRRSVTVLAVILVLAAGIFTYRSLPVELFPEIEFPLVTITTFYPSANPDAVVRDVTEPIENAIASVDGLDTMQSVSTENRSIILASFEFGTDMANAENVINSNVSGVSFPSGVNDPIVARINPDQFPVLQLSVIGGNIAEMQRVVESRVLPEISAVEGVFGVEVTGGIEQKAIVSVDLEKASEKGVSLFQISQALRENNVTLPGGVISDGGKLLPIKTTNSYSSLDDLRGLVVRSPAAFGGLPAGAPGSPGQPGPQAGQGATAPNTGQSRLPAAQMPQPLSASSGQAVTLGEVADITLGSGIPTSISRTNGQPSIGIAVIKHPDANTIDVTTGVMEKLDGLRGDLDGAQIVTVRNQGPDIQSQITTLEREAVLGLTLAVSVVFVFFLTIRPSVIMGVLRTLRPTVVIGLSIPLSIFTGVLLMDWQGLALNFMTLGGLAISVGRVVDDSIVVLENVYRNIEGGKERWRVALDATVEVGPAITASTLTTIVVFLPLGFIQGLVGAFFFPFAITVSFALIASLAVALTAVPVLGAYLLRPGDLPEGTGEEDDIPETNTWLQRVYTPILVSALRHKAITLIAALVITIGSLSLLGLIPVNLFPSGGERFVQVDMSLAPGTPPQATLAEVDNIEGTIDTVSDVYVTTVGSPAAAFGGGGPGGFNQSGTFVVLNEDVPYEVVDDLRDSLGGVEGRKVNVTEIQGGPPQAGLDVVITGANYSDISTVAVQLTDELTRVSGIENITSDVSEARDEIIINVDPARAAAVGLSAQQVAFQVNQFLVGQTVTQVDVGGGPVDVVLSARTDGINSVETIGDMMVAGPLGSSPLGEIAEVNEAKGPVTITRTDGTRSASITGSITSDDAQTVGQEIQQIIDGLNLPPGVTVVNGGVFTQISEGFQSIFLAMIVGVVGVYLVMVASLGSLRNPFVIITSLPLAIIGAFAALAITGRSLGLPAMMGILMLIGIVVTNAIVLISFVEQLRERGLSVYDALIQGGRVRLRPILMTAITTSIALLPLAAFVEDEGGLLSAELATVVIGGLVSSTVLTLVVVPVVYTLANDSIPSLFRRIFRRGTAVPQPEAAMGD